MLVLSGQWCGLSTSSVGRFIGMYYAVSGGCCLAQKVCGSTGAGVVRASSRERVVASAGPFGPTDHGTRNHVNVGTACSSMRVLSVGRIMGHRNHVSVFDGRVQSSAVLAVLELPHDLRTGESPLNTYKRPESVRIERGSSVWSCPSTCSPAHVCFSRVAIWAPAAFFLTRGAVRRRSRPPVGRLTAR